MRYLAEVAGWKSNWLRSECSSKALLLFYLSCIFSLFMKLFFINFVCYVLLNLEASEGDLCLF